MYQCTAPNLIEKPAVFGSLMDYFKTIPDQRSDQGKRFELAFLLGILFLGFLKGKTSVTACVDFALSRKRWLNQWFDLTHGIPDATTIGRASAVTSPTEVIKVVNQFMASVEGVVIEAGVSIDGKTIRAISELKTGCRHFISLFSHTTCRILDQEGVVRKENEITATPRLLARHCLHGTMVTADALLTQKKITQAVVKADADYLLVVKGNHPDLEEILVPTFTDPLTKTTTQIFHERRKTRDIKTTITMTRDLDLESLRADGWQSVSLVGRLERKGWRTTKRTKARVDETIYFITSRDNLILKQAYDQSWIY